ncbi:hypothetical protein CC1G_09748 [Coprinopsis cinerea okayama7|uniref:Uncharacterized protein n=1 Tax=Coprinopsis cinerea (strain Okayama-7 / 130 / ATCC MYA-4618 / FGSC 9003) TaxID=240176 RepID=A8PE01_COPC7|nr:hypothetical protein CC1G_09748 [Coprinopsis cinerea okayama7\|eukprot:XP_001840697.1 hypothetical protein CC1G_09748 [Coprinopsis cinerea okayama7\
MSTASSIAVPPAKALTSALRNLEKFINSRPETWGKDKADDKILFVTASYSLIDLLAKDPRYGQYRKKEYLGDAIFLWLKYLAKREEFRTKPETVNLTRFKHQVFQVPMDVPLLSGKPYNPHPSLPGPKDRSPSVALPDPPPSTAKRPTLPVPKPQPTNRSRVNDNDEGISTAESAKAGGPKRTSTGRTGKEKQGSRAGSGEDSAMEVDDNGTAPKRKGKKSKADDGPSWNSKDDTDDSYRESDDDGDETDSDKPKAIKKDVAKKKQTPKVQSVPVKRTRADDDGNAGASKRSKPTVPDGFYEASKPCDTCRDKGLTCFISKPRVACYSCKPPGQKRVATCNFSARRRKAQNDDGVKDDRPAEDVAEDFSTVNDDDPEEEEPTSASAIKTKVPRHVPVNDAQDQAKNARPSPPPRNGLDIVAEQAWLRSKTRQAKDSASAVSGTSANLKSAKSDSMSIVSTSADAASAVVNSTNSTSNDKGSSLSRVAPAAAVEFSSPSIERMVTRLLMENARQQASINYLTATLEVLLEDAKEYEAILATAATQDARIKALEAQVDSAEKEIQRMHKDRENDAKALTDQNNINTERIQGLAATVAVVNNWVASKIKAELGTAFTPPTETTINGIDIPMPLVTTGSTPPNSGSVTSNPTSNADSSNGTSTNPPPLPHRVIVDEDSGDKGEMLQYIKFPEEGPSSAGVDAQSTFLHQNGLQETEEVERLMREGVGST